MSRASRDHRWWLVVIGVTEGVEVGISGCSVETQQNAGVTGTIQQRTLDEESYRSGEMDGKIDLGWSSRMGIAESHAACSTRNLGVARVGGGEGEEKDSGLNHRGRVCGVHCK